MANLLSSSLTDIVLELSNNLLQFPFKTNYKVYAPSISQKPLPKCFYATLLM